MPLCLGLLTQAALSKTAESQITVRNLNSLASPWELICPSSLALKPNSTCPSAQFYVGPGLFLKAPCKKSVQVSGKSDLASPGSLLGREEWGGERNRARKKEKMAVGALPVCEIVALDWEKLASLLGIFAVSSSGSKCFYCPNITNLNRFVIPGA